MASLQKKGPLSDLHLLVQCKRSRFEKDSANSDLGARIGSLIKWRHWEGRNEEFLALKTPGTMWLVTVRPDDAVWLIGVYDRATLKNRRAPFHLEAASSNKVRVADITHLVPSLRFEDRKPITIERGHWKNAFQMVSRLMPASVRLLQIVAGRPIVAEAANPTKIAGVEGELVEESIRRRTRDPMLRAARLIHDRYTCQACGFVGHPRVRDKVVDVHHIHPLRDVIGKVETSLSDLLTLCPRCHRIVHAMAALAGKVKGLDVAFLAHAQLV